MKIWLLWAVILDFRYPRPQTIMKSSLFIPVSLDLVGIDTSTLIKVVKVLCTPISGHGGAYDMDPNSENAFPEKIRTTLKHQY